MTDDADNDVIQITAIHGTQAVSSIEATVPIKKEKDEEDFEEDIILNDSKTLHDLSCRPFVYTTRLDQMNVLKKINRLDSKEATEMIISESKPSYEQINEHIKREPQSDLYYIASYIELCSRVQLLNAKARTEEKATHLKNDQLMKMCKPCRIVLNDIKLNKTLLQFLSETYRIDREGILNATRKIVNFIPESSSDEDEPLIKQASCNYSVNKAEDSRTFLTTVAIKDKRSQEADIYILDALKGVRSYYKTSIDKCETIHKQHDSNRYEILEYCCWVNREKRIKNFLRTFAAREKISNFMRKPHNCLPRPCSCCCIFGLPMPIQPSNIEISESTNKNITEHHALSSRSIVEKASSYFPKLPALSGLSISENVSFNENLLGLKHTVIIFKYHRILFTQTEILGENYEIGNKGDITDYILPTVNRSIDEEKERYQKMSKKNKTLNYFSYMVCCWHKREYILAHLCDYNKLSPSAFRFIRNSHLCKSDKCVCCCKPNPKYDIINLQKRRRKKLNVSQKNNIDGGGGEIGGNEDNLQKTKKMYPKTSVSARKINKDTNLDITPNTNNRTQKPNILLGDTLQNHIDLSDDCLFQQTPEKPYNRDDLKSVDSLATSFSQLNSILSRFKDVKLTVNENGKLTAMINTPPNTLSAIEIKVLSDILSLAAKQIKKIGITPEEFCSKVQSRVTPVVPSVPVVSPLVTLLEHTQRVPVATVKEPIVKKSDQNPKLDSSVDIDKMIQNVNYKDPRGCKARQLNISFPKLQIKSPFSGLYQTMSSLGGLKNLHLMFAYKMHFNDKIDNLETPVSEPSPLNNKNHENDASIPKIGKVFSLAHTTAPLSSPVPKRKILQQETPTTAVKKLRVLKNPPPLQLIQNREMLFVPPINQSVPNVANVPQPNVVNRSFFLVNRNDFVAMQNANSADGASSVIDANPMPVMLSNKLIPLHNVTNSVVGANPVKDPNPMPLFLSTTKFIQNANSADVGNTYTNANQTPIILNNNFIPIQNVSSAHGANPVIDANLTPLFLSKTNFIRNASSADVADTNNENPTPPLLSNSNYIPMQNANSTNPQPVIRPREAPTIHKNSVEVANPVRGSGEVPLLMSKSDFIPMQNATGDDAPGVSVITTTPVEQPQKTANPRLYELLKQDAQPPPALAAFSSRSRGPKTAVRPLILAHSKGPYNRPTIPKRKRKTAPKELKQAKEIDTSNDNIDIESSLTSNIIKMVRRDPAFEDDDVIHVSLFNDGGEESIFGV